MKLAVACIVAALAPAGAAAQKLELRLDALASRAAEKAEVDLDGAALGTAKILAGGIPAQLSGLAEVHVRHYEFPEKGAYSPADLEHLRKQVGPGSGWARLVSVKDETDDVEIHFFPARAGNGGLLIVAGEARELTVVHLVGDFSEDKLREIVKSDIKYDLGGILAAAAKAGR
jgi:hypothetical protein